MLKLEKIIILFNLFYKIKKFKTYNTLLRNSKTQIDRVASCDMRNLKINFFVTSISQTYFFHITSLLKKCLIYTNKLYFCFKMHIRIVIVSIYYKKVLLFTIFKSLKKKIRTKKRLERLYKEKGLVYGVKKIRRWNRWIHKKRIRKKKNKKIVRKHLFKYIFKNFLKFVDVFKITNIYVYFFKSNRYIKRRGLKRTYQKRKHKVYRYKIIKKIKKLFFLSFFKNTKFKIKLSNNFSHSKKFLKLKKKRT